MIQKGGDMKSKKALVLDDNDMILAVVEEILTDTQFEVTTFSDPISFFAQKEELCCHSESEPCFDILITDNRMPGMTGLEFIEKLKSRGCKIADHRKAIISGNISSEELDRAKKMNCKVFQKPLPIAELIQWSTDVR